MTLRVLLVDDEQLARERLRELITDAGADPASQLEVEIAAEAASGPEALELLPECGANLALVDIHMPAINGIELARHFQSLQHPPAVIFVTAHDQYAVQAFELNAIDYLLKPVRATRLVAALRKAAHGHGPDREALARADPGPRRFLSAAERGKVTLVPLEEVLFLKAEQKYITACTREREFLVEDTLSQLEQELAQTFVRVHRNCLVARRFIRGVEQMKDRQLNEDPQEPGETHWAVRLEGHDQPIPISRRLWPTVKALVKP